MRKLTVGLLSAAALATTILLVRQQKLVVPEQPGEVPESVQQRSTPSPEDLEPFEDRAGVFEVQVPVNVATRVFRVSR